MQVEISNHRNEPAESKLVHFKPIHRGEFSLFFSFLTVYIDKDRKDHKMTDGAMNGTRLRDKSLSCERSMLPAQKQILHPQRYKITITRNSTRILARQLEKALN